MKNLFALLCFVFVIAGFAHAQDSAPDSLINAFKKDDVKALSGFLTKDKINNCFGNYSLLSQAIRYHAPKCFNLLIAKGADVNKICNNYVPPLMHAAKYGSLEMVKILVSKGADINFKYQGDYEPAISETPETYAAKNNQPEIAEYLKSLK